MIKIEHLVKRYGKNYALDDISFTVSREYVHSRALSRSVRTEKSNYLSTVHREADIVKRVILAVSLYKMLNFDHILLLYVE